MSKKRADVELRLQSRKYKQELKEAKRETRRFAKAVKGSLISGFRSGFGSIASFATAGGLADVGADIFAFEEQLIRVNIQASGKADIDAIRQAANELRADFGLAMGESARAGAALVDKLGGVAARADGIRVLGTRMVATGADMEDLAGLVQIMEQQFNLKGPENWARGLDRMIGVGKLGSVPLKEMATVGKQSAAVFKRLGADGAEGVGQLAAALQIAEQAFGTPAEGATGLKAMVEGLESATIANRRLRKELGQVGTESFIGLDAALDKLATSKFFTDPKKFRKAFPSAPARTMIRALVEGREGFRKLTAASEDAERQQVGLADAQTFAKSSAGQMKIAMGELRSEVEKLFTPERTQSMIKALQFLGKTVGFVIDNWELFLGAFLALKSAQIGFSIVKWARSVSKLNDNLGLASVAMKKLGFSTETAVRQGSRLGKIGSGVGALAAGFGVGQAIGHGFVASKEADFERQKKRQKKAVKEREIASEATLTLVEAGKISEKGVIDPELLRSLRVSKLKGAELTPMQQAAESALQGFEIPKEARVPAGGTGPLERLKMAHQEPERKRLVGTGEDLVTMTKNLQEAQIAAFREMVQEMASRPVAVEVKIGADTVATAVQNAPKNQRSPAP